MIEQAGWRNEPRTIFFTRRGRGLILRIKQEKERVNIRPRNPYFLFIGFPYLLDSNIVLIQ